MTSAKWLEAYSGQSADELLALQREYRIGSLLVAFEQALDQKAARGGEHSLSNVERICLAIEALEREVNNGGYDQFFRNRSREYAPIIADALLRIGCPETAAITRKAIQALRLPELTIQSIDAAMNDDSSERDTELQACDQAYYSAGESIEERLFAFLGQNHAAIKL